jgi:flagellar capping protein FliD
MATSSISTLDTYYQNLINYTLTQEKQPITRLTKQKDDINVKKAVYTDLNAKFSTLQNAINALRSSQATYAMAAGRTATVSPATSGTTVATAIVGSSVSPGTYALSVTTLARAQEVRSTRQTYVDQGLGYSGTFVLGGAVDRSGSIEGAGLPATVASVAIDGTNTIGSGQKELGTGAYFVETRNDGTNGWQFRIVDSEGEAQSIKNGSGSDFISSWQSIPVTGAGYDTGRGMKVTFGTNPTSFTAANKASGAVKINYTAKGAAIDVTSSMSLVDINSAINGASYAAGNEVQSTIIDNTLVLKNQSSGALHVMQGVDSSGTVLSSLGVIASGSLNTKVTAADVAFSINGMNMTRRSNSGLTDVIAGMTLNLASDAEGKSANIVVASDLTTARTAINTFISAFNDLNTYVRAKTTTVKNADNTYTRGSLVSEQNLRYTSNDLMAVINQDYTNTGIYLNLSQIGITINSDLSASVSDSAKLTSAMSTHLSDVTLIMDKVMDSLSTRVGTYSGTSGYINQSLTNANNQVTSLTSRISSMNDRISRRQDALVKQYSELQAQMETLKNQYTLNSTLYG